MENRGREGEGPSQGSNLGPLAKFYSFSGKPKASMLPLHHTAFFSSLLIFVVLLCVESNQVEFSQVKFGLVWLDT